LILVLIVPATAGLLILAEPVVSLLFEHGKFTAYDTYWTAWALRLYMLGLVFAALDWPLNYAFYARQDTLTPALVGVLSVGVYLAVALLLLRSLGMLGLVLADSAKHGCHALTMLVLTRRQAADGSHLRLGQTVVKALLATIVMAGVIVLALAVIDLTLDTKALAGRLAAVAVPASLGALCYLLLISLMRVGEIGLLRELVGRRLRRSGFD
jgi:putative peptidoglycan lipid II flippase